MAATMKSRPRDVQSPVFARALGGNGIAVPFCKDFKQQLPESFGCSQSAIGS